jgi:hypothetical protein
MPIVDQYQDYLTAGTDFERLVGTGTTQLVYGVFNEDLRPLLPFVDTGLVYCEDPSLLKYFHKVRFGGKGKIYVRAMVDNTEVQRGWVTLSEDPNQASIFHLPRGCAGYGLRLQLAGIAWWRYYEIIWDPATGQGGQ